MRVLRSSAVPSVLVVVCALCTGHGVVAAAQRRQIAPPPFKTTLTVSEMTKKQAVVDTTAGTFVIDLRPDLAPNHVGYFMKLAQDGAYTGTISHRVIRDGIIQGGDPLSKDPAKPAEYGTGGLGVLRAEHSEEPFTAGTVAAVIRPGQPDSAGSQFFVCATDQPALTGQYTVFGRVSDGLDVVQKISDAPADAKGAPASRIEIRSVTIRDAPPPAPVPFADTPAADLAGYRAVIETSMGEITMGFMPDKAPDTVRNFLRLAQAGVFDGTSFHRVVRGFVIQGAALTSRMTPLTQKQQKLVHPLQPELNDTQHVKGIISMAHGDDPGSATTSFFIVTGDAPSLDEKYTAFGRVLDGMAVVDKIEGTPVNGESPITRVDIARVRIIPPQPQVRFSSPPRG
ncbi:MAG: peptidylprolyl isomerase [Vicinamibacterales bacterium]